MKDGTNLITADILDSMERDAYGTNSLSILYNDCRFSAASANELAEGTGGAVTIQLSTVNSVIYGLTPQ